MAGSAGDARALPTIAVLILNWNNKPHVLECLESLEAISYPKERMGLFVVDNGSTDGSAPAIRDKLESMESQGWRDRVLVETGENLGFCGGNNAGYTRIGADFEWVYLSNDDVVYVPDCFSQLADTMADPTVGAVGPKVLSYYEEGALAHGAGYIRPLLMGTRSVDADAAVDCDYVTGCALAVRRDLVERMGGLFDERFFAYWEDTDLCKRVRDLGFRVVYEPSGAIMHKVSTSLPTGPEGLVPPARVYCEVHSKVLFARKHLPLTKRLAFYALYLARVPVFVLRTWMKAPGQAGRQVRAYMTALRHGFAGRKGERYVG
jgi:hypothetical protein